MRTNLPVLSAPLRADACGCCMQVHASASTPSGCDADALCKTAYVDQELNMMAYARCLYADADWR